MKAFEVTMGRPGGGAGVFKIVVHAATPDMARRTAEQNNPGCSAQAVRSV